MEIRLLPHEEAHIAALAARLGRSPDEVVLEAIAFWETRSPLAQTPHARHSPAEAATRILELRKGNRLLEGETIRGLIEFGRA